MTVVAAQDRVEGVSSSVSRSSTRTTRSSCDCTARTKGSTSSGPMTASDDETSRVAREETSGTGRPPPPPRQLLAEELQSRGASRPARPDGPPGPAVDLDDDGAVRVAGVAEHETLRVRQFVERDARRQVDDTPPPRVGRDGGRSSR
ncbi:hypothetical protein AWH69_07190 [Janibacter melonis]|uniref:Uncharacterized protein n=1 Tax=Janibacter melonis TaxID=262209 RepID=A0A176QDQ7_9MICO|nr:hypothetical protein AWH69_07190 [Janibacter melonis]